ncbi:exopolysaccharide biosynthesis polyprenyl glycosylphosphotransferase [Methylocystis sp. B8]|uniref:exopolysaccharide biosynthesis polyprenyl glycosylphosphotransferase n=1 Tax=Methylocystis sp. B8 TaxID=544938 RepID=UPI0014851B7B|nr:exopolysaccharide biosynthesis polyprenyl glycosylphosphotransferase [Methylocystis sp. B8]
MENYSVFFLLTDVAVIISVGAALSYLLHTFNPHVYPAPGRESSAFIVAIAMHFLATAALRTYDSNKILDCDGAIGRLNLAMGTTFSLFLMLAAATKTVQDYSRLWLFSWVLASWLIVVSMRKVALARAHRSLQTGACVNTSLSVGILCEPLREDDIAKNTGGKTRVIRTRRLSRLEEVASLSDEIIRNQYDQVHIATRWEDVPNVLKTLDLLLIGPRHISAEVVVLPQDVHVETKVWQISRLGRQMSLCVIEKPIYGWDQWWKRNEDIVIAAAALVLLSPLLLLIAVAIKLESPGPVIFRQSRAGFNGAIFEVFKFRSMFHHHADLTASRQTARNDHRVTHVGRFIRRTSFDELPQLLNVLQGTMSIVGPRPHALETRTEGRNLEELVEYYAARHRVKPGITGWAQVHGLRGELDRIEKLRRRVNYDLYYIENWSLWLDLTIILRTITLMFHDDHAY